MFQSAGVVFHAADLAVAHQHIAEVALRVRADLQGVAAAVQAAVLDEDALGVALTCALEAARIVAGFHVAVADDDVAAAVDVDAVVVVVRLIADGHALQEHAVAVQVVFHPAGGGAQRNVMHMHIAAIDDAHQERTSGRTVASLVTGEIRARTLPVQLAAAADADVLAPFGENQRLVHAHVRVLHGQAAGDLLRVIRKVGGREKPAAAIDHQADIAAQNQRAGDVIAAGQPDGAAVFARLVDGGLNRAGRLFAGNKPEVLRAERRV